MKLEDRDTELGEALDDLVRDIRPGDRGPDRVRLRGSRRRAARWTAIAVAVVVFVGGLPVAGVLLRSRPTPITNGPAHWSTYLLEVVPNRSGYLINHPRSWEVQPLDARCGDWLGPAVFFSNVPFDFRAISTPTSCGDQWDFRGLPAKAVAVDLDPLVVGPPVPGEVLPATHFPIRFDEHLPSPAPAPTSTGQLSFEQWEFPIHVQGTPGYRVRVYVGPEATAQDRAAARRIVGSIRPVRLGGQLEPSPVATLRAVPDHGPVGTGVELFGSGFDPSVTRDLLFGMYHDFNPPSGCELVVGPRQGSLHLQINANGDLRGAFVVGRTGVCRHQGTGGRTRARPATYRIFLGCEVCDVGTFRITPG